MKNIIIIIAGLCICISAYSQGKKTALQNLSGTYKSLSPEDWGQGTYGFREFSFKNGQWSLHFVLALDPKMKSKVFTFRTEGNYKVLDKSKTVEAFNAVFTEDKKYVTLNTDNAEIIKGFGLANCNLRLNIEEDISEKGCSIWLPVKECSEDHDLLAMDKKGYLYFGVRPADNNMCTADKRPTALLPPVAKN